MCGRYTLFVDRDDLEERFDARFAGSEPFSPRYNMAPGQRLPVVTDDEPETIRRLEWGLVPSWADDETNGLINARAETVHEKPSFRAAYEGYRSSRESDRDSDGAERETPAAGRCLVPANGFYEWVETDDGNGKRPYRVAFEDDRPFALAGLWVRRERPRGSSAAETEADAGRGLEAETTQAGLEAFGGGTTDADEGSTRAETDGDARAETAEVLETFAIVTTEPNDLVADLHHRMAVILDPDEERRWLTDDDPRDLLQPYPADELRAYPVSTAVNSPATDEPSLVEPIDS